MSFQEKYQEYKQRKEAKAFFNQNNAEKVLGKDYLIALLVVLGVLIAQTLYLTMLMPLIDGQLFINVFITCFKNLFVGDLLGTIIFLFGAVAAYMTLKD